MGFTFLDVTSRTAHYLRSENTRRIVRTVKLKLRDSLEFISNINF